MIVIDNKPFDSSAIINEYPSGSVQNQLLKTMSDSSEKYRYDSIDELKFELTLREKIVNAALELYKSNFSFSTFRETRANEAYWERKNNGALKLKDGVKPSDAIRDIFKNGDKYASECATAMVIVYYKALLDVFPEDLFNKLFSNITLMNWHSLDPLLKDIGTPKKVKELLIGDRGYFDNPQVNPETPEWQGENVIVLPGGLYYGHGVGIYKAEQIIEALNGNRVEDATESARLLETAGRPDFKRLADIYYKAESRPVYAWDDSMLMV